MKTFLAKWGLLILLLLFTTLIFVVNLRINFFRYNNFDFGKFDLGNMSQMLWNTLHGRFMYLTDYFGTNMPRWAMSHVDPILLLFIPVFAIFQSPMTLVVSQLVLVLYSSVIIFLLADLHLKSKLVAFLLGLAYLFYPAVGFLTAWTGFHGVTAAIPFFLSAFYVFDRAFITKKYSLVDIVLFTVFIVITLSGKEQISLYVALYGLFIVFFRNNYDLSANRSKQIIQIVKEFISSKAARLGWMLFCVGVLWFITCFFIIIPSYAHYRINGFTKFATELNINVDTPADVTKPNYFLQRYEEFGDSYVNVIFGVLTNPEKVVRVFFGGDKLDNFKKTFDPVLYLPFFAPQVLFLSLPDFLINYLTTAGGIGTAEIFNHRISMIVPVIFLSSIFAIKYIGDFISYLYTKVSKKTWKINYFLYVLLSIAFLASNIYFSFSYSNPVYMWLTQSIQKHLPSVGFAYAKTDTETAAKELKIGDIVRLSPLDNKDRECAKRVVSMIPDTATVSGPDYLGAHLSMRETYAIFPASYTTADYVIVDVFSKKILNILNVNTTLITDVVENLLKNPNYDMVLGCGNLFVFQKMPKQAEIELLPFQERFSYIEKTNLEIFQTLTVVDYTLPKQVIRGKGYDASLTYVRRYGNSLQDYVLFTSYINKKTGDLYQSANLPSFAIKDLGSWSEGRYYVENIKIVLPKYLDSGEYQVFIGMTNSIRTRSLYLGNITVL